MMHADGQAPIAPHQPQWPDQAALVRAKDFLCKARSVVGISELVQLNELLEQAYCGEALILQAGDCSEPFEEMTPAPATRKLRSIQKLADLLEEQSGKPTIRVARIAGQFAKPRSSPVELVSGQEMPSYFGDLVNGAVAEPDERAPNANRLIVGYLLATDLHEHIRKFSSDTRSDPIHRVWTSHEALLLDYELPQLRRHHRRKYLGSTHFPWIGYRTSRANGMHVAMLAEVDNPVACKVGTQMAPSEVVAIAKMLNPKQVPGRLTLIARFGAERIRSEFPAVVAAVRASGIPVMWTIDPLHGNTTKTIAGVKTRVVADVLKEVIVFREILADAGAISAGLHLEVAGASGIVECIEKHADLSLDLPSIPLCDPRLNASQAARVIRAWISGE